MRTIGEDVRASDVMRPLLADPRPAPQPAAPAEVVAVDVRRVSKRFKLYHNLVTGPVKEILFFWKGDRYYRAFLAVDDVSLTVRRGEVVGIIGSNGAGKTTLLKMIAGLLPLDSGSIAVRGRVTALLALGVGVNPDFTGRENIYYGGLMLGMSKKEISEKTAAIIEFSELADFIDQPFGSYSSGMRARLLFSISMSVDPDILIVDEALATGDAHFVAKCMKRIHEICRSGATIIFVSHNLRQVEDLCDRCLVMRKGRIVFDGETGEAIPRYIESLHHDRAAQLTAAQPPAGAGRPFRGTGEIQIEDAYFTARGKRTPTLRIGEPCELHIDLESSRDLETVTLCVEIYSEKSPVTFAFLPSQERPTDESKRSFSIKKGKATLMMPFHRFIAGDGVYRYSIELFPSEKEHEFSYDACYCYYNKAWSFQAVYAEHRWFNRGTLSEIPSGPIEIRSR